MDALWNKVEKAMDGRLLHRILLSGPVYAPPMPLMGFNPMNTHPVERRNPIILPVDNKRSSSIPDTILYWLLFKITGIILIRNPPPLKRQNLIRLIDIQLTAHKHDNRATDSLGQTLNCQASGLYRFTEINPIFLEYPVISRRSQSTKEHTVIFCPVRQNDFIDHFAATGAFPGIK